MSHLTSGGIRSCGSGGRARGSARGQVPLRNIYCGILLPAAKGVRKQGAHAIGDSLTPAVAPGNFGVESEARAWFGTGMCKERFASTVATSPGQRRSALD